VAAGDAVLCSWSRPGRVSTCRCRSLSPLLLLADTLGAITPCRAACGVEPAEFGGQTAPTRSFALDNPLTTNTVWLPKAHPAGASSYDLAFVAVSGATLGLARHC